ncbi:MAG: class I SAM-dependent methyltransferase [Thermoanaerobaculia bacterium]
MQSRPDYGIDAPGVIRNLLLVTAAGLAIWSSAALGLWSGVPSFSLGNARVTFPLARMATFVTLGCGFMAAWMVWDSKVGKIRDRERLLDFVPWKGNERVLDLGCGRGLMLIGAAKRLTTGTATGIDIWQSEDLSGNRPESTLQNVELEGVADRVRVETADMRKLPFDEGSIDVIVSCAAIHNLYEASDREQAMREIARVLKPGGMAVLDDIRHGRQYTEALTKSGCDVRSVGSRVMTAFLTLITMGSLRPTTLVSIKRATA